MSTRVLFLSSLLFVNSCVARRTSDIKISDVDKTASLEIYGVKSAEQLTKFKSWGFTQVVLENHGLFLGPKLI